MKIELKNNFHNTMINININEKKSVEFGEKSVIEISHSTYRNIFKKLCGSKGCTCGWIRDNIHTIFDYEDNFGNKFYYIEKTA